MSFLNRYNVITKGAITFSGNTLGLSQMLDLNRAGDRGSIGAFITLNNTTVSTFPLGTTLNYKENSSQAVLNIPSGSTVLYAELVWGGNYLTRDEDLSANIDDDIIFTTPDGVNNISPDNATATEATFTAANGSTLGFYVRSQDVTDLVSASGAGTYTVGSVVGLVDPLNISTNDTNHAGWTLAVIYSNPLLPLRSLSLNIGGTPISINNSLDVLLNNFITPITGDVNARLLLSTGEGDASILGDGVAIGPVGGPYTALAGLNNLENNFFGSQINDDLGTLDTTGTFGDLNQGPQTTSNIVGGRQGWDITNIDIKNMIGNGQTEASLQFRTQGDLYMSNAAALQIDLPQPIVTVDKKADKEIAKVLDIINYTINLTNSSEFNIDNVVFKDVLPAEISYNGDFAVNGTPTFGDINTGINIGTVNANSAVTVTFSATVISVPLNNVVDNTGGISYTYTMLNETFTGSGSTNTVSTFIANPSSSIVKNVDKEIATNKDVLNYTVTIINTGNVTNNNVVVKDIIPSGTTLVPNSLQVITLPLVGDLVNGVILGDMAVGQTYQVIFSVTIDDSVNAGDVLSNNSTINFTVDINGAILYTVISNTVDTLLQKPTFDFTKMVDKTIADIGDKVKYTFVIKNTGTVDATNVNFIDLLQFGNDFVMSSLVVNGSPTTGDPTASYNLSTISVGETVTISFDALVTAIPPNSDIQNVATINYNYIDGSTVYSDTKNSNTTDVLVNTGIILSSDAIKTADKSLTTPLDTVTYTVSMKNSGNVPLINVLVKDVLPAGTTFEAGTVIVNGISMPIYSPVAGIPIATILPNETATVSFVVKVLDNGVNTINNTATILYSYNVGNKLVNKTVVTNNVVVDKVAPIINIIKSQNKLAVTVGDTVTYTLTVSNTGTADATSVLVSDLLDMSLQFLGNMKLNNVPIAGNIIAGVNIGALTIGQTDTLTFDVKVNSVPDSNEIKNVGKYISQYVVAGSSTIFTGNGESNIVNLNVITPQLTMTKVADRSFVQIGDTFKYTITVKNDGNIAIENAVLTDFIPADFAVTNISVNGVDIVGNLSVGVPLGIINVGATVTLIVSAVVLQEFIPNTYYNVATTKGNALNEPNILVEATATDIVGITFIKPHLSITKSSNVPQASVGEVVTYTLLVNNDGDVELNNVVIKDLLTPDLQFVSGSVVIDGVPFKNDSIISGINLGTLSKNEIVSITFDAKIISKTCEYIINKADATFNYILGPNVPSVDGSAVSNENKILVQVAEVIVTKTADKQEVELGDIVTYTVKIANVGSTVATNVIFIDELPTSLQLVNNQVILNGVIVNGVDLSTGINLGNMNPGDVVKIIYSAKVIGGSCDGYIKNSAFVKYNYVLDDGTVRPKQSNIASVTIIAQIQSFKQIIIDKYLEVPHVKPDIEDINDVFTEVIIDNFYVVKTPQITSNEGQVLSGYKLVIHGSIKIATKYTALLPTQPVHSAHYTVPFGSFIILPSDYVMGSNIEVTGIVEGIRFEKLDNRHVFANTAILLIAKNIM